MGWQLPHPSGRGSLGKGGSGAEAPWCAAWAPVAGGAGWQSWQRAVNPVRWRWQKAQSPRWIPSSPPPLRQRDVRVWQTWHTPVRAAFGVAGGAAFAYDAEPGSAVTSPAK